MEYAELVARLCKPDTEIVDEMTRGKAHLLHMSIGLGSEVGEIMSQVKAHCMYDRPLELDNLYEELGDLEFYLEGLRQRLGISREAVIEHNRAKLSERYHEGRFSNRQAQDRADKR